MSRSVPLRATGAEPELLGALQTLFCLSSRRVDVRFVDDVSYILTRHDISSVMAPHGKLGTEVRVHKACMYHFNMYFRVSK